MLHHHFLRKTVVFASDYGIEMLDLSNMSLPANQLGLKALCTFFASYESQIQPYIGFGHPWFLKPLEEVQAKFVFIYKKEIVNFILLLLSHRFCTQFFMFK